MVAYCLARNCIGPDGPKELPGTRTNQEDRGYCEGNGPAVLEDPAPRLAECSRPQAGYHAIMELVRDAQRFGIDESSTDRCSQLSLRGHCSVTLGTALKVAEYFMVRFHQELLAQE
jgi:hypothetical protein